MIRSCLRYIVPLILVAALNIIVLGVERGLKIVTIVAAFWFGVYLPTTLAWEYYKADADERAEWRAFYRSLINF